MTDIGPIVTLAAFVLGIAFFAYRRQFVLVAIFATYGAVVAVRKFFPNQISDDALDLLSIAALLAVLVWLVMDWRRRNAPNGPRRV